MSRAPEGSEGEEMAECDRVSDREKGETGFREGKNEHHLAAKHQNWTDRLIGDRIYHRTSDHAGKKEMISTAERPIVESG